MQKKNTKQASFHIPHAAEISSVSCKKTHTILAIEDEGKAYRLSRSAHLSDPYDLRLALVEKAITEHVGIPIVSEKNSAPVHTISSQFLSIPSLKKIIPTLSTGSIEIAKKKRKIAVKNQPPIFIPLKKGEASHHKILAVTVCSLEKKEPTPEKQKARFFARTKKEKKKKNTSQNTIWGEMLRFGVTTAIIFLISFSVMNAPALGQILSARLNPAGVVEKQIALEKMVDKTHAPILPTAGMKFENRKVYPSLSLAIAPLENRIVIPKIGKNVPIVGISDESLINEQWKQLEDDIQNALRDGVVHYPGTANPGEIGNVFITGHSSYYFWDAGEYKDVFALLHDLYVGDEFTIFWNQDIYHYRILERKVVPPSDTSVLNQPRDKRIATLMTCTPIGTAKDRLILVAEQIDII